MKKLLYTVILMSISVIIFMNFSMPVKALSIEIEPDVYLEMKYTEYEYFNNGFDIIYRLEVSEFAGNDDRIFNFLYFFQLPNLDTQKFIFSFPHIYRVELETSNGIVSFGNYVRTIIIDFETETMTGYNNEGLPISIITKNEINQLGTIDIRALRDTKTGIIDYQEAYNDGFQNGYQSAQNEIKEIYGIYYQGEWLTADEYGQIQYDKALSEQGDLKLAIKDFIPGILGSIFMFFFTLSGMSIIGISILDILLLIFGVGAMIFFIKLFFK